MTEIVIRTVERQRCANEFTASSPISTEPFPESWFPNGLHPGKFNIESGNRYLQKRIVFFGYPSSPVFKSNHWGCMM